MMTFAQRIKKCLIHNNTINQTIFKNTFWLLSSEFFRSAIRFFIQILIARELGAEGYGFFSFALSFVAIFGILLDFGFPTLILREVSCDKNKAKKLFDNIFFIKLTLVIIVFLLIVVSAKIIIFEKSMRFLIYLASVNFILGTFSEFFKSFFRAFEKMQWEALSKIFEGILLTFLIGLLLVRYDTNLKEIFYSYIIIGIIILIFNLIILVKKFLKEQLFKEYYLDFKEIKLILKKSLPLVFSAVFISIYYYIDQIMLGIISTKTELGYYSASQKIVYGLLIFHTVVLSSFSPKISYFFKKDIKGLSNILVKMNKIMLVISIPMGVGGSILAPEIISFIFGSEYARSILALQILIWGQVIVFIGASYGGTLIMCNQQRKFMYGVGLGTVVNMVLNFILITKFSLYGASVATVITQLLVFIYMYLTLSREVVKIKFYKYITKPLLASLIMITVLLFLKTNFSIIILVPLGIIFYFLLLFKLFKFKF